jgi:predicted small metal-binding protein
MGESRKVIDCRTFPESKCSLSIAGSEAEVLEAAVHHAITKHGHKESPELKQQLRSILKDER